jgi:hypothetical protein
MVEEMGFERSQPHVLSESEGNTMQRRTLILIPVLLAILTVGASPQSTMDGNTGELTYRVVARKARLNRLVTGEVTNSVNGVPAEPVHSFVWDGEGSNPILGTARFEIDPVNNTGKIIARWRDEHGTWKFTQTAFAPPDHPSGLRVGPGAEDTMLVTGDPVPVDVYLHGDTTAGGAVLPTLFNLLATWGPAEVTLNGEPFENPFDGPAPLWAAHTMTTVGVRNSDGEVLTVDGDIFDPTVDPTNGAVDYGDLEFHLVFHDAFGPGMTENFPPPFSFFYHLTFEDVKLSVKHSE